MRICQSVPVGSTICDTIQIISAAQAKAMRADGVDGVARYLETLTAREVSGILDAGLGIIGVSYADVFLGTWAASVALGVGLVAGTTLAADLESDHQATIQIVGSINAYGSAVTLHGFRPCVYDGADQPLSAEQLGELEPPGYWKSLSNVETPTLHGNPIGFQLIQHFGDPSDPKVDWRHVMRGGVNVDVNTAQRDNFGRSMSWTIAW